MTTPEAPRLSGQIALITGANHGIGAATALALANKGADVAVTYLRLDLADEDPGRPEAYAIDRGRDAEEVVKSCQAAGVRAISIEADLKDVAAPKSILDQVEAELGPVSILVHNASGWRKDTFSPEFQDRFGRRTERVAANTIDAQFMVDARAGAIFISEMAARHHANRRSWGRVITLTSGGPMGFPGEVSYGAAKAALENYTMAASIELANLGITANVVYPPVTDTGWVTNDVREFVKASSDHVHVAEPEEVAGIIAWLCTSEADLITGNVIRLR